MENFSPSKFFHTDSFSPLNSVLSAHSTGPGTGRQESDQTYPSALQRKTPSDLLWLLFSMVSDILYSELKTKRGIWAEMRHDLPCVLSASFCPPSCVGNSLSGQRQKQEEQLESISIIQQRVRFQFYFEDRTNRISGVKGRSQKDLQEFFTWAIKRVKLPLPRWKDCRWKRAREAKVRISSLEILTLRHLLKI